VVALMTSRTKREVGDPASGAPTGAPAPASGAPERKAG